MIYSSIEGKKYHLWDLEINKIFIRKKTIIFQIYIVIQSVNKIKDIKRITRNEKIKKSKL